VNYAGRLYRPIINSSTERGTARDPGVIPSIAEILLQERLADAIRG
jgi:hypothetical protein